MPAIHLDLHVLLPEFLVAGAALGVILVELLLPPGRRALPAAAAALGGLGAAVLVLLFARPDGMALWVVDDGGVLLTAWRSDPFGLFLRTVVAIGGLLTVLLSIPYTRRMDRGHGEFYAVLLTAILGVLLVTGVSDFLSLFVCLELVTISSYVLVAFKRNDLKSTEAGMKYLLVGAVSSAILLFGIALVYGAVGEVSFDAVARHLAAVGDGGHPLHHELFDIGMLLVVVGILFKVGGVPFQVWIPDVYQGAPTPVTAFLSTGSKTAGVALFLRLAQSVFLPASAAGGGLAWVWILGVVSVMTLLFGILGAVPQRDIKRLLGYSSIGHAGYLLMGVAAVIAVPTSSAVSVTAAESVVPGVSAILYYLLAFFFTNLTAFTVIVLVSRSSGGRHGAPSYSGLALRSPFLALCLCLALLSLAGVPPLAGFFGKFLILTALVEKGMFPLALIGALGVVVSLYFYLLWIKQMYMLDPDESLAQGPIRVGPWARTVLIVGITAMLLMGVVFGPFKGWAETAARSIATALP